MTAKTKKIIDYVIKTIWWIVLILLSVLLVSIISAKFRGEVPKIFGYSIIRITTPSMGKTIPPDTYILIKETAPEDIGRDDIICFYSDDPSIYGYLNTHRVVRVIENNDKYEFVTKGDGNGVEDIVTAKGDKLVGKYVKNLDGLTWFSQALSSKNMGVICIVMVVATAGVFVAILVVKSKEDIKK